MSIPWIRCQMMRTREIRYSRKWSNLVNLKNCYCHCFIIITSFFHCGKNPGFSVSGYGWNSQWSSAACSCQQVQYLHVCTMVCYRDQFFFQADGFGTIQVQNRHVCANAACMEWPASSCPKETLFELLQIWPWNFTFYSPPPPPPPLIYL